MNLMLAGAILAAICLTLALCAAFMAGQLVANVNAMAKFNKLRDEVEAWKRRQEFDATMASLVATKCEAWGFERPRKG